MPTDFFASLPVFVIPLLVFGVLFLVFRPIYLRYRNARKLLSTGSLGVADVVSSSQTGVTINNQPEMRVVLTVENVGGTPRQVEVKQIFDLGSIPRAGDRVYVLIDPINPDNVVLAPPGAAAQLQQAVAAQGTQAGYSARQATLTPDQLQDITALTPTLQNGKLGVVRIISATPAAGGATTFEADVDAIGQPVRRVRFTQVVHGRAVPPAGSRTYVLIDPANPATVALVPPSVLGGRTLPAGANRLDPLVLGPQLLQAGAKASGVVQSARQMDLAEPQLAAQGITKWELSLAVTPADGTPAYTAPLTISLLNQERVARIAHAGAEVPLRYDAQDLNTISIDSVALGYPDPYADLQKVLQKIEG